MLVQHIVFPHVLVHLLPFTKRSSSLYYGFWSQDSGASLVLTVTLPFLISKIGPSSNVWVGGGKAIFGRSEGTQCMLRESVLGDGEYPFRTGPQTAFPESLSPFTPTEFWFTATGGSTPIHVVLFPHVFMLHTFTLVNWLRWFSNANISEYSLAELFPEHLYLRTWGLPWCIPIVWPTRWLR